MLATNVKPIEAGETKEAGRSQINLVLFSGGSGTQSITEALLKHPQISLTIVINAYDDGHSTGRLRRFIPGMLGPSDVRKNINRLMPATERCHKALKRISDYRLPVGIARADALAFVENFNRVFVIFACIAKHIGDNDRILSLTKQRQFFLHKGACADVLQANCVQHARCSLEKARRRIAGHRFARESLYYEPAQLFQLHNIFELDAVCESSTCRDNWILELNAGKLEVKVDLPKPRGGGARSSHRFIEIRKTVSDILAERTSYYRGDHEATGGIHHD